MIYRLVKANLTPIAIVIFAGCYGYLVGNPIKGMVIGTMFVTGANIFMAVIDALGL